MELPDEKLAERWIDHSDRSALDELVQRHVERVRRIVVQMTSNSVSADDITQEIFLRAIRGLLRFRIDSKFSTWLYRIAMNCCHDWRRKNARKPVTSNTPIELASSSSGPGDAVLTLELKDTVGHAVDQLSDSLRAAVVLTAMEGLTASQAAEIEGCTVKTLHWRVHKARGELKKMLEGYVTK